MTESLFGLLKHGPLKVCVLGSGNWGTACARLICANVQESYLFDKKVKIWVREETVSEGGRMLHDVMNEDHENVKYLPGFKLPDNLYADPDITNVVADADLIAFILPHQYMESVCHQIAGHLKPTARAISLAKGLHIANGIPYTFSALVEKICNVECSALSGANVAKDVANEQFCETTIGFTNSEMASIWQQLFDRPHFRVHTVPDPDGLQVCGAIKNLIALSAGFCDGLGMGSNTKSAIIRIGTNEMKLFATLFFEGVLEETFFDSCGFADVITTCFGGRNVKCAAEFIRRKQQSSWDEIERDMLGGMKMQGQYTCKEVYQVLTHFDILQYFPLFEVTYKVAFENAPPEEILRVFMHADVSPVKARMECSPSMLPGSLKKLHHSLGRIARRMNDGQGQQNCSSSVTSPA